MSVFVSCTLMALYLGALYNFEFRYINIYICHMLDILNILLIHQAILCFFFFFTISFLINYFFAYLFCVVVVVFLSFHCFMQVALPCRDWLLIVVASRCRAQGRGVQASVAVACRFSSCSSQNLEQRLGIYGAQA